MKNQNLLIGAGVVVVGYFLYKKMKNKKLNDVVTPEVPPKTAEVLPTDIKNVPSFFIIEGKKDSIEKGVGKKYTNTNGTFFVQDYKDNVAISTPTFLNKEQIIKAYDDFRKK